MIASARRMVDSRCAMTNDVRLHQVRERVLHEQLGLGVERRGRFVEDQDRRVLQERARDREPLPLPAGQALPALADRRVVAVGQLAMNSCACAARAAASISSRDRAGAP